MTTYTAVIDDGGIRITDDADGATADTIAHQPEGDDHIAYVRRSVAAALQGAGWELDGEISADQVDDQGCYLVPVRRDDVQG